MTNNNGKPATYYTPEEFALILKIHRTTVVRMAAAGKLPGSILVGTGKRKSWRIPESAIQSLVPAPQAQSTRTIPKQDLTEAWLAYEKA